MNNPERALAISDREERLLAAFAERMSQQMYGDYEASDPAESRIDVRAIWSAIYRNRILIAAVLLLALAGGVASILLTTPTYRGVTTVHVDQQSAKVLGTEDVEPVPSAQEAELFLQTQVDIIKSRGLASRVAADLNLIGDEEFLAAVGAKPLDGQVAASRQREQMLRLLDENLTVTLPRKSRIVGIAFDSRDPRIAAEVANSFAENFISSNLQRRFDMSAYSRNFLQKQLALTKAKLEQSERSLISYARSAQLIDASAGAPTVGEQTGPRSLTTANLVQLNQAYSQALASRVAAQQRWAQVQSAPLLSLPEVLSNPAVQQLTQRRAELEGLYQQERERRKEGHPTVRQVAANIAELDRQIDTIASGIRNSIRDQYLVALRQEQALAGNVGQLESETLAEQDRGVRYNILKREVDTNRELYDGLLQRYKEVGAQAGVTNNNISVVDRADPPMEPVSPRPAVNMALAGLGGLVFAFLLVFVRERFDDAVRSPEDVDTKLHLPLLGVVPLMVGRPESFKAALTSSRSPISEAHQALRSSIELSSAGGIPSTLLLTSSRPSEGKSTTAYALARDLATVGQRVLLIDADLRKPSLHRLMSLSNEAGLSSILARQKEVDDVIQPSDLPGLQFIGTGPIPPNPAQLLATNLLEDLLSGLKERYDVIVIDGPPVLGLADAPRLASTAESVVFVIEANRAHRGQAKAALKRLLSANARVIGAVLTKFDPKKIGHADYGYGYSYRYGSDNVPKLDAA
ncbi:MAG TPA: polysaccharide biosynthesis tyrosine autokinase [Sphingomicrobium sp.]|nr:polysaccharide biosynthesis tyrosine autokinase [Sphingomicrobium sp.]